MNKNKEKISKEKNIKNKNIKNYNYFDAFVTFVDYSCKAASMLQNILINYDVSKLESQMVEMHDIEHAADVCKHEMMNQLVKEFITPIEREDIIGIGQEIDDVTDTIEDVLMRMYMFNIQSIRPEALELTEVIVTCCEALKKAMTHFHNFKKSKTVKDCIIDINRLEESGDKIYTLAMHNLHSTSKDTIEVMVWTETFDRLEKCCDACEDVANMMESVIMKNT